MEHFGIAAFTVGKVLFVASVGLASARLLHGGSKSIRGLGYYMSTITLPCLLLTRLIEGLTWELVRHCYWATLMAMLSSGIGFASASIVKCAIPTQFHGILLLASTFQNALSFPLSILVSIHGLSWFSREANVVEGETYLFLYNVWASIGIWGIGGRIVRKYKRVEANYIAEVEARCKSSEHAAVASPSSSSCIQSSPPSTTAAPTANDDGGFVAVAKHFYTEEVKPSMRPPVVATLLGLLIALTPPLAWAAQQAPGQIIRAGLAFVGNATIPMQLLLLGCNLVFTDDEGVYNTYATPASSPTTTATALPQSTEALPITATQSGHATAGLVRFASPAATCAPDTFPIHAAFSSRAPVPVSVIMCVSLVRLILVPAMMLPILHLLIQFGLAPDSKIFKLVICVEACSPGAINGSVICTLHRYRVRQYTKVLLVEYLCAVFTVTMWLTIALWWIG